jgi:hypothetical protein
MVLDVELAAEVLAGSTYSLAGVTLSVYDASHAQLRANMCPEPFKLPLKPSAMTLRSYVLPYSGKVWLAPTPPPLARARVLASPPWVRCAWSDDCLHMRVRERARAHTHTHTSHPP